MRITFPGYIFQITNGPESQKILGDVKGTITAFVTQKVTLKAVNIYMRPGHQ